MNTDETSTTTLEGRFSFDASGQELPGMICEATPAEIETQLLTIDRAHIRRGSEEMEPPECRLTERQLKHIMALARAVEKKTYKHRKAPDRKRAEHRRGVLGDIGLELLELLGRQAVKTGRIFHKLKTLAAMLRKSVDAVVDALKRLKEEGFVVKHRRSKMVQTPQGWRRRQDSNAYEVRLPPPNTGAARIPGLLSESTLTAVSVETAVPQTGQSNSAGFGELIFQPRPYRMPDLTVH